MILANFISDNKTQKKIFYFTYLDRYQNQNCYRKIVICSCNMTSFKDILEKYLYVLIIKNKKQFFVISVERKQTCIKLVYFHGRTKIM